MVWRLGDLGFEEGFGDLGSFSVGGGEGRGGGGWVRV